MSRYARFGIMDDMDLIATDLEKHLQTSTPEPLSRSSSVMSRLHSSSCGTATEDSGIGSLPSTQERSVCSSARNRSGLAMNEVRQNLDFSFAEEQEPYDEVVACAEWLLPSVPVSNAANIENNLNVRHFAASVASKRACKLDYIEMVRQGISGMTEEFLPVPTSRLIGVNCGLEYFDVLSELNARSQYQPLKRILSYLDDSDLCK